MTTGNDHFFEEEDVPLDEASKSTGKNGYSAKKKSGGNAGTPQANTASRAGKSKGNAAGSGKLPPKQAGVAVPEPPHIGMVIAIALVALVLGFALGYFVCLNTTSQKVARDLATQYGLSGTTTATSGNAQSDSTSGQTATGEGSSTGMTAEMPAGHPDLSQFYNPDGTINEEALNAYRASMGSSDSE